MNGDEPVAFAAPFVNVTVSVNVPPGSALAEPLNATVGTAASSTPVYAANAAPVKGIAASICPVSAFSVQVPPSAADPIASVDAATCAPVSVCKSASKA